MTHLAAYGNAGSAQRPDRLMTNSNELTFLHTQNRTPEYSNRKKKQREEWANTVFWTDRSFNTWMVQFQLSVQLHSIRMDNEFCMSRSFSYCIFKRKSYLRQKHTETFTLPQIRSYKLWKYNGDEIILKVLLKVQLWVCIIATSLHSSFAVLAVSSRPDPTTTTSRCQAKNTFTENTESQTNTKCFFNLY